MLRRAKYVLSSVQQVQALDSEERERLPLWGRGGVRMDFVKELVVERNHEEWVKF